MEGSLYYPHLFVVREDGDPALRTWVTSFLVEDRSDQHPSYQQYIGELRTRVRYFTVFKVLTVIRFPTRMPDCGEGWSALYGALARRTARWRYDVDLILIKL